jgi:hypothetical protein
MVDLTTEGLDVFWQTMAKSAPFIVASMDGVENWVIDHDAEIDGEVIEFGKNLPDAIPAVLQSGHKEAFINDFMVALAYLRSSRALRLVKWAETAFPEPNFMETVDRLYADKGAEEIDRIAFKIMMDRLRFMWKTHLLQTIFSPERIEAVKDAARNLEEET